MTSIAMMVGGALTNVLAFFGCSFLFSQMSGAAERKRHKLAIEQLQRERDTWNEQRLARKDFINKSIIWFFARIRDRKTQLVLVGAGMLITVCLTYRVV